MNAYTHREVFHLKTFARQGRAVKEDSFTLPLPRTAGTAPRLHRYHLGRRPGQGLFPSPCFVRSSQIETNQQDYLSPAV